MTHIAYLATSLRVVALREIANADTYAEDGFLLYADGTMLDGLSATEETVVAEFTGEVPQDFGEVEYAYDPEAFTLSPV